MITENIDRVGIELYSRWKESKLGDVLEIKYGKDHKEISDGDIPIYGSGGIMRYGNKAIYEKKSILIPRKGSLNNIFYREEPFWTVDTMFWTKINEEKVYPKFLFYQLTTVDYINLNVGSAVPSLTVPVIQAIDILLPPLQEQTAIASILTSLDDKINLLHRQNKTLEQLAETLFRQWFVEEAEESWETVTLGQYVKTNLRSISKDYTFTEIEYLDTSSLTEGIVNETQKLFLKNAPSRAKRLVQNNEILISTVRPDQKHYGIINNPIENLVVSTGFCVITCTDIDPYFVYLLLTNDEMTQYLHSIAEGSTSTYPSLKPSDIEKIEFQKPSEEKLNTFGKIASDYWNKIYINQTQIRTLTQTRDTLLPKLMSGEVRVNL